jgi:hypothetical protein
VVNDAPRDDLAQRCTDADSGRDGSQREVEAARAARQVRDDQRGDGCAEQRSLRTHPIDERPGRRLREDACDPSDRESKPDALLVPFVPGEVDGEEWPYAGLNVGQKEVQPVQAAQRSRGGRRRRATVRR